mgnify:CR=1 FL=1
MVLAGTSTLGTAALLGHLTNIHFSKELAKDPTFMVKLFGRDKRASDLSEEPPRRWRDVLVMHPLSRRRLWWEVLLSLLILWSAFEIPLSLAFLQGPLVAPLDATLRATAREVGDALGERGVEIWQRDAAAVDGAAARGCVFYTVMRRASLPLRTS